MWLQSFQVREFFYFSLLFFQFFQNSLKYSLNIHLNFLTGRDFWQGRFLKERSLRLLFFFRTRLS